MEIISSTSSNVTDQYCDGYNHGPLVAKAMTALVQFLGEDVAAEEIRFKRQTFLVFSDASLDVPEVGQFYAQVRTPGYKISFEYEGITYIVHTDMECDRAIVAV